MRQALACKVLFGVGQLSWSMIGARIHDRGTDQSGQRHDSKAYSLIELLVSGRPVLRYVEHH
jgi:hypothetical protein